MAKRKVPPRSRKAAAARVARTRKAAAGRIRRISAARGRPKRATAGTRKSANRAASPRATVAKAKPPAKPAIRRTAAARGARYKPPALDRVRRTLPESEIVPSPPSSLALDRRGSAVRTGHAEIQERLREHTETGPALTGGDIDANWEKAYHTGDEAPGGDNPTPNQDVVEEIGRSLGVEYADAEELKGAPKLEERDRHRWELDPASSEDYRDRGKK